MACKKVLFFLICLICIIVSAWVNATAEEYLVTQEEFLQTLADAEVAAIMFTRPERPGTGSRVGEFDALFLPKYSELSAVYAREDNYSRMLGGLSRPEAFKRFLKQYFSDSVIESLSNGAVIFDDESSQVYWRCTTPQYSYDIGEAEYSFMELSSDRIVCRASFTFEGEYSDSFDYVYERTDTGWVFTSFVTRVEVYERLLNGGAGSANKGRVDESDDAPVTGSLASILVIALLCATAYLTYMGKNKKQIRQLLPVVLVIVVLVNLAGCAARPKQSPLDDVADNTSDSSVTLPSEAATDSLSSADEDWNYVSYSAGTVILTEYTGSGTNVTVPVKIDDLAVVGAKSVFRNNPCASAITSLTILGDVNVDEYFFEGLNGLRKLSVDSVPVIHPENWPVGGLPVEITNVFSGITELAVSKDTVATPGFLSLCTGLKSITFSSGLETVEDNAFSGLAALETVVSHSTPKTIGANAFRGCTSLRTNLIGDNTTSIGSYAFYGCAALNGELIIGKNISYVGNYAFFGCDSISRLVFNAPECKVEPLSSNYESGTICFGMSGLDELVIGEDITELLPFLFSGGTFNKVSSLPSGLKKIGRGCFACCAMLSSITLPKALESIGEDAFYGCCSLTGISFPASLISVGSSAFMNCDRLKSVDIGNIANLPEDIFCGCADLTSVNIGCSNIGDRAFYLCTGLKKVQMVGNVTLGQEVFGLCMSLDSPEPFRIPN